MDYPQHILINLSYPRGSFGKDGENFQGSIPGISEVRLYLSNWLAKTELLDSTANDNIGNRHPIFLL